MTITHSLASLTFFTALMSLGERLVRCLSNLSRAMSSKLAFLITLCGVLWTTIA